MKPRDLTVTSAVPAPAPQVWRHATSFEGINFEMMPMMRMTTPPSVRGLDAEQLVLGEPLFRSWILLFGVLPV